MCQEKAENGEQNETKSRGDACALSNENATAERQIILPKEVQVRMLKFFLKTSIPRKKRIEQEKLARPSSNTSDGSEK